MYFPAKVIPITVISNIPKLKSVQKINPAYPIAEAPKVRINGSLLPVTSAILGTNNKPIRIPTKYIDPNNPILWLGSQSISNFSTQFSMYSLSVSTARYLKDGSCTKAGHISALVHGSQDWPPATWH